ncbi:hypothetical protein EOD23_02730 [Mesorhizobium sp. USDA-HM6]|nr:hypothetical protein EOD23_02730 [Mesorhizobium sp. USDA-HM6]
MRDEDQGGPPSNRRRLLLAGLAGAGAALPAGVSANASDAGAEFSLAAPGSVKRRIEDKLRELPSLDDFGARGDGVTDDSEALQAALDWAGQRPGTRLRVPPRVFGLARPIAVPQSIELAGEVPGDGNSPLSGFRALKGFETPYVLHYSSVEGVAPLPLAALLVSREWVEGKDFARRLHMRDLYFDVDAITARGGVPVHGLMLANQQLDIHNIWIRSATGFGLWINTQRPDGTFMAALVDNLLRRVWVRGAGVGGASFKGPHGEMNFGGILVGALPGARDPRGAAEPPLATDGILDYCTVAVGPEALLGCRGNGIHITQSAGWRATGCHLNGAGRNGMVFERAFQTEISGCYIDGWGVGAGEGEGVLSAISCNSVVALGDGADGSLIISSNRIACRSVAATAGNDYVAFSLRAGSMPTARAVVIGNTIVRRGDATHAFSTFDFGKAGGGEFEALVIGNSATGTATHFLRPWDETAVRPRFTGNSFQFANAPPSQGWHPVGLRIDNDAPTPGAAAAWFCVMRGSPGNWRSCGRIDS